ncbi:hypothetical protein ABK040_001524 [Willaertia magna]
MNNYQQPFKAPNRDYLESTIILEQHLQQVILKVNENFLLIKDEIIKLQKAYRSLNERLDILETLYFNEKNNKDKED